MDKDSPPDHDRDHEMIFLERYPGFRKATIDLEGMTALVHRLRGLQQIATIPEPPTEGGRARWLADLRQAIAELPTEMPEMVYKQATSGILCIYELEIAMQCLARAYAMAPMVAGLSADAILMLEHGAKLVHRTQTAFVQNMVEPGR